METKRKFDGIVITLRVVAIIFFADAIYRVQFAPNPGALFVIVGIGIIGATLFYGFAEAIKALRNIEFNTRQKP